MMSKIGKILLVVVMLLGTMVTNVRACQDPPPMNLTTLRLIIITLGPPVRITLVYDPWMTFGAAPGMNCACAFKLPPGMVASVDAVRLVQTGTNTPISGFSWVADPDTTGAVETISASGVLDDWFGFSTGISQNVPAGTMVDFQADVTLTVGMDHNDLVGAMNGTLTNRAFSDGANANGTPNNSHQALVTATHIIMPTVSQWGLAVMALLVLSAATIVIRGRRPVPV